MQKNYLENVENHYAETLVKQFVFLLLKLKSLCRVIVTLKTNYFFFYPCSNRNVFVFLLLVFMVYFIYTVMLVVPVSDF